MSITPTPESACKHLPEVRYMLLVDMGTQWFTKLARIEVETSYERSKKLSEGDKRIETVVNEQTQDVPSEVTSTAFLSNIYGRYSDLTYRFRLERCTYGGWYLSGLEYERIKRLIELVPVHQEFMKLGTYSI